jgi:hypothetical protein
MAGQRVEQNTRRDHERHQQERREKSCVVASIDIAWLGMTVPEFALRLQPNGQAT